MREARSSSRPSFVAVVAPMVLVLGVVLALAWSAWSARREHRRAAEETVRSHAAFAATLAASNLDAEMEQVLLYAFYGADLAERGRSAEPVLPETLATNPPEAGRCSERYPGGRWFARVGPTGELDVHGPLPSALAPWLRDTLVALQSRPGTDRHGNLYPADGDVPVVAYRLRRDESGAPVEAHALAHCFEGQDGSVFDRARRTPLLPRSVERGSEPVVGLTVVDPRGAVVHRSGRLEGPVFAGTRPADASGPLAGLTISAVVPASMADELVPGGVPGGGPGATALLALLAAALGVTTVLQVRRSLALARARERFVANVSHELRTPLQLVLLFAQLLRLGRAEAPAEREEAVAVIEREARRLIALVERVLAFAVRGGDDGRAGEPEPVDVGGVAGEVAEAFRPMADEKSVLLTVELPPDLPAVRGRSDALRQVLLNLLDNAVRHGPPGQEVVVRAAAENGSVDITVDDEGPGIPVAERERVWQPFRRVDPDGGGRTGSGIGLAVVRDVVRDLEGRAWIEDAPGGRGTRVVVRLPAADGDGEEA